MKKQTYSTFKAVIDNCVIAEGHDAIMLRELDLENIEFYGLCNRDIVCFQQIVVTVDIESRKEYRYGFDGLIRDVPVKRTEVVESEETLKLSKRKGVYKWSSV